MSGISIVLQQLPIPIIDIPILKCLPKNLGARGILYYQDLDGGVGEFQYTKLGS